MNLTEFWKLLKDLWITIHPQLRWSALGIVLLVAGLVSVGSSALLDERLRQTCIGVAWVAMLGTIVALMLGLASRHLETAGMRVGGMLAGCTLAAAVGGASYACAEIPNFDQIAPGQLTQSAASLEKFGRFTFFSFLIGASIITIALAGLRLMQPGRAGRGLSALAAVLGICLALVCSGITIWVSANLSELGLVRLRPDGLSGDLGDIRIWSDLMLAVVLLLTMQIAYVVAASGKSRYLRAIRAGLGPLAAAAYLIACGLITRQQDELRDLFPPVTGLGVGTALAGLVLSVALLFAFCIRGVSSSRGTS